MTGMEPIAHIHTDLPQKFGIPRNSFLAPHLQGRIVFEPEFASNAAVEGLDSFSHLWLLWRFENGTPGGTAKDIAADAKKQDRSGTNAKWSKTVRPPRLGGAERVGVFATRSPFRPNPIGLTCVKSSTSSFRKRCRIWSRLQSFLAWLRFFARIRAARAASTSQTVFITWPSPGSTYLLRSMKPG